MSCLRATALTDIPPARLSATISRFSSIDHIRRRSGRVITRIRGPRVAIRSVVWLSISTVSGPSAASSIVIPHRHHNSNRVPQCVDETPLTVHAERLVHKLDAFTDAQRAAQERIRALVWWFCAALKAFRAEPTAKRRSEMRARFDRIFARRTVQSSDLVCGIE